ncbi:hypothetical protein B9Z55_007991 [Caenorhabditis nigoni]|uniref:Uncharacterized protein n=1 Tax=Caenorhabditis nigoni TaxID=1611254 RepID=A0A2G5VC98_9PELO|nr:hypothetical protein B9Z55_007991 [Caenorhabditis nigoni]
MIHTKKLELWDSRIFRISFDLKIRAESIEARWSSLSNDDLDRISKFLGPKPLKEFSIELWNYEALTHPIVRNSEKLVLWRGGEHFDPRRINHKHIHLKSYDELTLIRYMDEWIENDPEVGMELSGDVKQSKFVDEEILIKKIMYLKKFKSGGNGVKPDKRFPNTLYSISMPRTNDPDTEIQMSLIKNAPNDPQFQIHLKIQPAGTAIPERFDSIQYIVSQIPGLRKVEKSLPLHLDHLKITTSRIRINQYEYYFSFRKSSPTEKPSAIWKFELFKKRLHDDFSWIDSTLLALVSPIYESIPKAAQKLVFDLIGNRPTIYTKKWELWNSTDQTTQQERSAEISRLPSGLKIQAEIIEALSHYCSYADLDQLSNILAPSPLEEFSTQLFGFEIFTHPIVRNSQKLVVWRGRENFDPQRINHRNIHLKNYSRPIIIDYMNAWIENGPEVGMEFTGDIKVLLNSDIDKQEESIKEIMYLKKSESGGRRVKPDEGFPNTLYSISMPRTNNPNTEIQMSLIKIDSIYSPFLIHLKVQPSGTSIPEQSNSMYWEWKLSGIRQFFETGETQNRFGQISIFRLNIVSQIPGFRKVEKSLPLHLDYLKITDSTIRIDQYQYYLTRRHCIYPTDNSLATIQLQKRRLQKPPINGTVLALVSPIQDNFQKSFKKLVFDLFGNRPMIYTKTLELWYSSDYPLPVGLKIQAQIIEARLFNFSYGDLDRISNVLGPKPLEEFSTQLNNYDVLTHPIVQNSRKLVLWRGSVDRRINHRNIHLKGFDQRDVLFCMNAWIANGPEIGMEFFGDIKKPFHIFLVEEEILIKEMMYLKKCELAGRRVKPDERFPHTVYSVSTPGTNDPNTEIQMSLIKNESIDSKFQIHLKVQPSGTAIPEQFDAMYWELKLLEIRKICQSVEFQAFLIALLLLFMPFFLF